MKQGNLDRRTVEALIAKLREVDRGLPADDVTDIFARGYGYGTREGVSEALRVLYEELEPQK